MKKLIALLCMFTCIFSLSGCSEAPNEYAEKYDKEELRASLEYMVGELQRLEDTKIEEFLELKNEDIAADNETALAVKNSYKSWLDNKDELGAYTPSETDTCEMVADEDGAVVTIEGTFELRPGKIVGNFDHKGQLESFKFEPIHSTVENLANAGMNTVIGMGTVFVVLIFIAFLISLFKYINKAEAYFAKRKEAKTAPVQTAPVPSASSAPADHAANADTYEEVDDLELVAVITAAVAASMNTSVDQLVVRSIRRKTTNKWQKA